MIDGWSVRYLASGGWAAPGELRGARTHAASPVVVTDPDHDLACPERWQERLERECLSEMDP